MLSPLNMLQMAYDKWWSAKMALIICVTLCGRHILSVWFYICSETCYVMSLYICVQKFCIHSCIFVMDCMCDTSQRSINHILYLWNSKSLWYWKRSPYLFCIITFNLLRTFLDIKTFYINSINLTWFRFFTIYPVLHAFRASCAKLGQSDSSVISSVIHWLINVLPSGFLVMIMFLLYFMKFWACKHLILGYKSGQWTHSCRKMIINLDTVRITYMYYQVLNQNTSVDINTMCARKYRYILKYYVSQYWTDSERHNWFWINGFLAKIRGRDSLCFWKPPTTIEQKLLLWYSDCTKTLFLSSDFMDIAVYSLYYDILK